MSGLLDALTQARVAATQQKWAQQWTVRASVEIPRGFWQYVEIAPKPKPKQPHDSMARIANIVCGVWGIPAHSMPSPRRSRVWSWPRQCAVDLCRKLLPDRSLPQIGRAFGNRDHSTVMHAIAACAERLKSERPDHVEFAAKYRDAEAKARAALGITT